MKDLKAWILYGGITLAIMMPLLTPGFILTLDLVFVPDIPMPQAVSSSYLFHAGLHLLNLIIPSDVLEKIILAGILLLASFGMHRLIRAIAAQKPIDWGIYIASIFFAVNPFTYSRFMAGQYAVLLGYALLPWVARQMIVLTRQLDMRNALKLGLLITLVGILSIHTLVAIAILGSLGLVYSVIQNKKMRSAYLKYGVVAFGCFVVLSSYWLVPLALGQGKTASTISSFTTADTAAFATVGESPFEKTFHVLRLQGFWAEAKNLYLLPQDKAVAWGLMLFILIGLAMVGAVKLWPKRKILVLWFGTSALVGILLAIGFGSNLVWGLREPHKMVMLLALFYGVFLAFGINHTLAWLQRKNEVFYGAGVILLFAIPPISMTVMWWGCNDQLRPRQYPSDWSTAKTQFSQDGGQGSILFLPWHQYMTFQFAGRIIASPAPTYFGERIIASQDPELGGASSGQKTDRQQTITHILENNVDAAQKLASQDVRYVVLAKDLDYQTYNLLSKQPAFELMQEYPTLLIYKNTAWRQL